MNHSACDFTIICYDISNNKLRSKIEKTLKDFGVRIQYSIFMCNLDEKGIMQCRMKLANVLDNFSDYKGSNDSIFILERISNRKICSILGSDEIFHKSQAYEII